jgi:serine/threonine-protein kinase
MGAVYLGERVDDQYRSLVAIKLVRGSADPDAIARFRRERQILADLSHPNIARLLDGGTTEDGIPYVVMEYIEGRPLDRYCDEHKLSVADRIELFREVCKAVQHAHSRMIVHRDLKPGNILVTSEGVPKLLDFGIAKLIAESDQNATLFSQTESVFRMMTPTYASPEQMRGEPITLATDVYGLGAVLYELLVGQSPHQFKNRTPRELEEVICERLPQRPSRVAVTAPAGNEVGESSNLERARARNDVTPSRLANLLSGDLDNIVAKALQKEPERRYRSAAQLSDDLKDYLDGRPVRARGDDWGYRAGKFARRHRLGVGAAAVFVLLLVTFSVATAIQAARLAEQSALAEQRRLAAEQVSRFLIDLFAVSDPNESRGNSVTAREILDKGTQQISELSEQPAVQATLQDTMGLVYMNLGLYDDAEPLLRSSLETKRRIHGKNHTDVAATLQNVGTLEFEIGNYDAAEAAYREALFFHRSRGAEGSEAVAETANHLATLLSAAARYDDAERYFREALTIRRRLSGEDSLSVATGITNLAHVLRRKGELAEAEELLRRGLELRRRHLGDDHLDVAHSLNQLSRLLSLRGHHDEALPLALDGLGIRKKSYGGPHAEVAASLGNVAGILANLGRLDESVSYRQEVLETLEAVVGNEHPYIAAALGSLGGAQFGAGDLHSAEENLRRSLDLHRKTTPSGSLNLAGPTVRLGEVLMAKNQLVESENLLREALELRKRGLPPEHWQIAATRGALGECLVLQGRFEEAELLLRASLNQLETQFGIEDRRVTQARRRLDYLDDNPGR